MPIITYSNGNSLVDNANDIKVDTLGSAYKTVEKINGGLPILKEFYWEHS